MLPTGFAVIQKGTSSSARAHSFPPRGYPFVSYSELFSISRLSSLRATDHLLVLCACFSAGELLASRLPSVLVIDNTHIITLGPV